MSVPEGHRRAHPITPLVGGWKIIAGILAVVTAQNLPELLDEFTIRRALIGAGIAVGLMIIAVIWGLASWWRTTYAVTPDGVDLHHGIFVRSERTAPEDKIDSVSVERPFLARILGLAKVRIEIAGGGDSHLDIEYLSSQDAERLRREILHVAAEDPEDPDADPSTEQEPQDPSASHASSLADRTLGGVRSVVHDGVTDGELLAEIPTTRLLRAMLRDPGALIAGAFSLVFALVGIGAGIANDGLGIGLVASLIPAVALLPRLVLSRLESGWGFVSRSTERGVRMRRGLFSTRTDNIAPDRVQAAHLDRPLLWRGPGWTSLSVTVAGIEDDAENGASAVLPVGTDAELAQTLGHLMRPLGTEDDLATLQSLLAGPARAIAGVRAPRRWQWISRRTRVSVLLDGALVHRSGILSRKLQVLARDRIQQVTLREGPIERACGLLTLRVDVADGNTEISGIPAEDACRLAAILRHDAATLRRYSERETWVLPPLRTAA